MARGKGSRGGGAVRFELLSGDVAEIGQALEASGLAVGPRLFAGLLSLAAMGAVSRKQGWRMTRGQFMAVAAEAYDWAQSRAAP